MKEHMKLKIELFADNARKVKGKFVWQNVLLKRLAALLYAAQGKEINYHALQESYDMIKENTGYFSYFRGNSLMSLSALLSLHEERNKQFANTLAVYDRLKAGKFRASDYLVVAAYQIAANTGEEKYVETVKRAKAFYEGMRAEHRLITGSNDYIYAAMLALADIEIESGLRRMEELHQALRPVFHSGDGVQALSQVLTLGGESRDRETRVLDLAAKFRQRGMRLDTEYTLPSLGVLCLLPADADTLVSEVAEAYEILRTKKGFGRFSVTKQELLLLCSALVSFDYAGEENHNLLTTTLSTSITNLIIAQQTALAVAAAMSASVAASSSS